MTGTMTVPYDFEPKRVRALIIPIDGAWSLEDTSTYLDAYQQLVEGFVAIYYPTHSWHLYCHEATSWDEPVRMPGNKLATELAVWGDPKFGLIVRGTAVIVGSGPMGQDLSVPKDVVAWVKEVH